MKTPTTLKECMQIHCADCAYGYELIDKIFTECKHYIRFVKAHPQTYKLDSQRSSNPKRQAHLDTLPTEPELRQR